MKSYETVFILNPALSEDQVAKSISKYEKILKSNGAKLVHKENWGLKKLAYTIENKNSGFYNLFQFTAPSEMISPFEVEFLLSNWSKKRFCVCERTVLHQWRR